VLKRYQVMHEYEGTANKLLYLDFGSKPDLLVFIELDKNRKGTVYERAARATRWLWSVGIYPSPTAISLRMHGRARNNINDRECKGRKETMILLGIPHQRNPKPKLTCHKPIPTPAHYFPW